MTTRSTLTSNPSNPSPSAPLRHGATIGILGGGQLGRMLSIAAAQLGYRCHIYSPEANAIASHVAAAYTQGAWDDEARLSAFAEDCQAISYEFENIPMATIDFLENLSARRAAPFALHPNSRALAIAQDRLAEKRFVTALGGQCAAFVAIDSAADLLEAIDKIGAPAILKTRRMGYDGKGQARIAALPQESSPESPPDSLSASNAPASAAWQGAWQAIGEQPAIAEQLIDFEAEFSVLLVRANDGAIRFWDSPCNVHRHGILASSSLPAPAIVQTQQAQARELSAAIAEKLGYVGVLCCEYFATASGALFNEMAPRVHNSGHWTIEGAQTSQFANHIRTLCGLPLGETHSLAETIHMRNLIGADEAGMAAVPALVADPQCHLHLYGKAEARIGRKVGHATWVGTQPSIMTR